MLTGSVVQRALCRASPRAPLLVNPPTSGLNERLPPSKIGLTPRLCWRRCQRMIRINATPGQLFPDERCSTALGQRTNQCTSFAIAYPTHEDTGAKRI